MNDIEVIQQNIIVSKCIHAELKVEEKKKVKT